MIGLAQPLSLSREHESAEAMILGSRSGLQSSGVCPATTGAVRDTPENKVVGVICSGNVAADRDQVKQLIQRGLEQRPDAVWVCLEPKSDRMTHDVMISLDIDPVVLPMTPAWQAKREEHGYDLRRIWRDGEMLLCDELIVFHKRTGDSPWRARHASGQHSRLFVVDLGPIPATKKRAARKPVSA